MEAVMAQVPEGKRAFAARMLANGKFHLATARMMLNAREFRLAGLDLVSPDVADDRRESARKTLLSVLDREAENVRSTIPVVEVDSALGWEPIMLYVCRRPQLEWKLRQIEEARTVVSGWKQNAGRH